MTRRFQAGSVSVSQDKRYWLGKWRDEHGKQHTKLLGKARQMTKSQARDALATILRPVNAIAEKAVTVEGFLMNTYFPLMQRKWKTSTYATNRSRMDANIIEGLGDRVMDSLTREDLQAFLDARASMAKNTVSHLRWDLKQMFDLAMAEGMATKNPALMLFIPKACVTAPKLTMSLQDVRTAVAGLELRERLVFKLATVAGMRPGEIFALRRGRLLKETLEVKERIWKGELDSPKTARSVRSVALATTLQDDIEAWLALIPTGDETWLFPSEMITTPLNADNFLSRHLKPALKVLGLGWVTYQVMRRTHASLMHDLGVDPKVSADGRGHNIGVSLDVYTQSSLESRIEAAETLGNALVN